MRFETETKIVLVLFIAVIFGWFAARERAKAVQAISLCGIHKCVGEMK